MAAELEKLAYCGERDFLDADGQFWPHGGVYQAQCDDCEDRLKKLERARALGHEEAAKVIENGSYATIPGQYRNEAAAAIRALSKEG